MAKIENFDFFETLTGFKWIGNKAYDLKKEGYNCLFAYEVEIGFAIDTSISLDKDGIRAAAVFGEMSHHYYNNNITLIQQLDDLYKKYGYYLMKTKYFFTPNIQTSSKLFGEIRENGYPKQLSDEFKIKYVRDLTIGYDNSQIDNKPILPIDTSSQMITFTFEDGSTATIRSSGTEPKIKWYVEVNSDNKVKSQEKLDKLVKLVIDKLLNPNKFNLVPPKD